MHHFYLKIQIWIYLNADLRQLAALIREQIQVVALKNGEDHHSLCALLVDTQATMPAAEASQSSNIGVLKVAAYTPTVEA